MQSRDTPNFTTLHWQIQGMLPAPPPRQTGPNCLMFTCFCQKTAVLEVSVPNGLAPPPPPPNRNSTELCQVSCPSSFQYLLCDSRSLRVKQETRGKITINSCKLVNSVVMKYGGTYPVSCNLIYAQE